MEDDGALECEHNDGGDKVEDQQEGEQLLHGLGLTTDARRNYATLFT
jgi:hypothetical protein